MAERPSSTALSLMAAFALFGTPVVSHAQAVPDAPPPSAASSESADAGPPDATALQPPLLRGFVEAEYPVAALDAGLEGSVLLMLSIDRSGHVAAAEVIETAGHGFDEAASAAALRFEFAPATRGDAPIAARIQYRYTFQLPPPAAASVPAFSPEPTPVALAATSTAIDVIVRGNASLDAQLQSAEALKVIDAGEAKRRGGDMGDLLVATQGVNLRRDGGLGSTTRFSLNGLSGDQVRMFIDGLPLELAGYPFGIANVPVNAIDHVELFSGVVPIRLGADALGGAVNLVTNPNIEGTHAAGSYQVGSFETHRATLSGQHRDDDSGVFARVNGFVDYARNDYPIDVEVPDDVGHLSHARVYRFHDAYHAAGGNAEVGVTDRSWAERLALRVFVTNFLKDYQSNPSMTVPYGGVSYGELTSGGNLRYEQRFGHGVAIDLAAGYTFNRGHFRDLADCVYDWFGRCIRARTTPGETGSQPHDQLVWDNAGFGRFNLSWRIAAQHTLRLAIAPTYLTRSGDERLQTDPSARDPLSAQRELLTVVSGVEYAIGGFSDPLENIAFAKQYIQRLDAQEPQSGHVFRQHHRSNMRFGIGDGIRYRFVEWLYAKLSYEFATRLPNPEEVFGDNAFVVANLDLQPETSHNVNVGMTLDAHDTRAGKFRTTVNAFLREAKRLIVLLGSDQVQSYQNVFGGRSLGIEAAAGWTSRREYVAVDGNVTYQDFRNDSTHGTFRDFAGDRIPNQPYLFANGSARLQFSDIVVARDRIQLFWNTRYVQAFFRGWESLGLREYKQIIPAQVVHSTGLGYLVRNDLTTITSTLEFQNLTDERVFDNFGAQRPGRAFYLKTTAEF